MWKGKRFNLERWRWEPWCWFNGVQDSIFFIGKAMGSALNHDLRREESIKLQGLDVGLLADSPLAGSEWVLPPHIIPVIHMVSQQDHRHLKLEITPAYPREQQLRFGGGGAPLWREQLHHHRPAPPLLLRRGTFLGILVLRRHGGGGGGGGGAFVEAGEETRRHSWRVASTWWLSRNRCNLQGRDDKFTTVLLPIIYNESMVLVRILRSLEIEGESEEFGGGGKMNGEGNAMTGFYSLYIRAEKPLLLSSIVNNLYHFSSYYPNAIFIHSYLIEFFFFHSTTLKLRSISFWIQNIWNIMI